MSCNNSSKDDLILATPKEQQEFVRMIDSYVMQYKDADNELQKSALRTNRKVNLEKIKLPKEVADWVGVLVDMSTTSDGKAVITIQMQKSPISLTTMNNGFSDSEYQTLISHGSEIYDKVAKLSLGDFVKFSGCLFFDKKDYFRELSITEDGSMTKPEFLFKFSDINPYYVRKF